MDSVLNWYHLFGSINTLLIFVSVYGVYCQLATIWRRRTEVGRTHGSTELLSQNQFTVSFLAYLSFFIYGYSIAPFNHYIVWPRLVASILVCLILFEIWRDRKSRMSFYSMAMAVSCLAGSILGLVFGDTYVDQGKVISTSIILLVSVLIAQGYAHQITLIVKSGATGAVNLRMSQFILLMDISTIAFALSMGLEEGWPLMVLAVTSGITKLAIMYLFYWVRVSPVAQARRNDWAQ